MNKLFQKVKENLQQKYISYSVFACILLSACHSIQFVKSGYILEPLIHAIMSLCFVFCGAIFGKKSLPYFLFVDAILNLFVIRFTNFTPFLLILICIYIKPKLRYPYLIAYIFIVCFRMWQLKDSWTHLAIHFLTCSFFYFGFDLLQNSIKNAQNLVKNELNLEEDEEKILNQLATGKEKNDIEGYSEITVYRKLKEARNRNFIFTNEELIKSYKNSMK